MTVDMVNHPPHYQGHPSGLECIEVTRGLSFCLGNTIKYLYRAEQKNGRQDLEKAAWYLRDHVEHCGPIDVPPISATLRTLAAAEPHPCKQAIYYRISVGAVGGALDVLERWITEDPPF
jgi:hypothetical protein